MARRKEAHGGGHGWFVTFADLMGLLVSFFVMLVAFSNQDAKKVAAVAGSMRDAFGVQSSARFSGIVESEGLPTRDFVKNSAHIPPDLSSVTPSPDEHGSETAYDRTFSLAAASLRRALQGMPELAEASKHIMLEESRLGLNIEIVDQENRPMFPEGSKVPYESARRLIEALAAPLRDLPYRVSITGHTAPLRNAFLTNVSPWDLSADRANTVRQILEEAGYHSESIYKIEGKADTEPLFPDNPLMPANNRVTITLMREAPSIPPDLQP